MTGSKLEATGVVGYTPPKPPKLDVYVVDVTLGFEWTPSWDLGRQPGITQDDRKEIADEVQFRVEQLTSYCLCHGQNYWEALEYTVRRDRNVGGHPELRGLGSGHHVMWRKIHMHLPLANYCGVSNLARTTPTGRRVKGIIKFKVEGQATGAQEAVKVLEVLVKKIADRACGNCKVEVL